MSIDQKIIIEKRFFLGSKKRIVGIGDRLNIGVCLNALTEPHIADVHTHVTAGFFNSHDFLRRVYGGDQLQGNRTVWSLSQHIGEIRNIQIFGRSHEIVVIQAGIRHEDMLCVSFLPGNGQNGAAVYRFKLVGKRGQILLLQHTKGKVFSFQFVDQVLLCFLQCALQFQSGGSHLPQQDVLSHLCCIRLIFYRNTLPQDLKGCLIGRGAAVKACDQLHKQHLVQMTGTIQFFMQQLIIGDRRYLTYREANSFSSVYSRNMYHA